ncbi:MAG: outer membrane protein OmpA-like peptidoglycan-associated protein [Acidimicrobiales bacterium]
MDDIDPSPARPTTAQPANRTQTLVAVAACFGIFLAGLAVGRAWGDEPDMIIVPQAQTASPELAPPPQQANQLPSPTTSVAEQASTNTSELPPAGPEISVEGLERDLAVVNLDRITFATGTSALTSEGRDAVQAAAAVLMAHPFIPIEIEVRTYTEASAGENHGVSTARAEAISAAFTDAGVSGARLATVGLGNPGDNESGDQPENRVELEAGPPAALTLALRSIPGDISFDPGTAILTTTGTQILAEVKEALMIDPAVDVEISVHTYSEETSDANHDLSHHQGEAMIEVLVLQGIPRDRLTMIGHGDPAHFSQPGRDTYVTFYGLD